MYYVNREQIDAILAFVPQLSGALRELAHQENKLDFLHALAQERALQLAIECVTDVGSLMIDGFIMRDASSYEDIVEIMRDEQVIDSEAAGVLTELVLMRKPLMQQYYAVERAELQPLVLKVPDYLDYFASEVRGYLEKELS